RRPRGGAFRRRGLPLGPTRRAEGGRAGRLGVHRGRRTGAFGRDARDARVARGLALPRTRLIARGLGAPLLVVADAAPGLVKAVEQCWPASDRQHCAVHRVRNLLAKLPDRARERVRQTYWQALDEASDERDAKQRLKALVDELDKAGYTAAARCLAD